ncbi:gamma-secretase subunit pen-2 [Chrysoperla carnea]|uniref:gamma-secretase subunit pen-2 n=1 Tax=Chrysoperla carnea TaxID=189513 RepID=UPI001D06B459|nr:gamma-secretase subunit pen-2 [Chrysoperla carnea]
MDLGKLPGERKLYLCQWYFKAGFAFLPFLWAVNFLWFFSEAFRKPVYDEQKQIKKYVVLSGIGTLIWFIILTSWIIVFQTHRVAWGEFADYLSFIIPLGEP